MTELFLQSIRKLVEFTPEETEQFLSCLKRVCIPKKSFHLKAGEICTSVAFINSGMLRAYYTVNGEDITGEFIFEGNWISDYPSFLTKTPGKLYVEALEDSELFVLDYNKLQWLYTQSQNSERFGRLIAENLYIHLNNRIFSFLTEKPEDRYKNLIKRRPNVAERIPQHYIASYLGVRPESLSRIRKRMAAGDIS